MAKYCIHTSWSPLQSTPLHQGTIGRRLAMGVVRNYVISCPSWNGDSNHKNLVNEWIIIIILRRNGCRSSSLNFSRIASFKSFCLDHIYILMPRPWYERVKKHVNIIVYYTGCELLCFHSWWVPGPRPSSEVDGQISFSEELWCLRADACLLCMHI